MHHPMVHATAPIAAFDPSPPPDPVSAPLAAVLAGLPRMERRRFNHEWRFAREAVGIADQIIRRPLPGADQAEQVELLLSFLLWRCRLLRRTIRRARLGELCEAAS